MATSPKFIDNYKSKPSSTGTLEFTANKPTRLYNAYCRNSTGAGNISITGTPPASGSSPVVAPIVITHRLQWLNSGTSTILSGGYYYEVIKHGIYPTLDPININITGTFPLVNNTSVEYQIISTLGGEVQSPFTVALAAADTRQEACDKVMQSVISNLTNINVRLSNNQSQIALPTVSYVFNQTVGQLNVTVKASAAIIGSLALTQFADFTGTAITNGYSYAYAPLVVDGKSISNSIIQSLTVGKPVIFIENQANYATEPNLGINGVLAFPYPGVGSINENDVWDTSATAGTVGDPYLLRSDLKSKLNSLIADGLTVDGQEFQFQSAYITTTEDIPSPPVIAADSFSATVGESKDVLSDTNAPFKLTDVQGNKFYPINAGQKIKITAPQAETIILVYAEE